MNVILYCRKWDETVAFYKHVLGFHARQASDWLVEFDIGPYMCLSVANAERTTVKSSGGVGITITLKVNNARKVWKDLTSRSVKVGPVRNDPLGCLAFFLNDPEGNRLEFWSDK